MRIFKLPDLGEGLPDAEIHEWFVKEGDTVELDQVLCAMETAKAVVEVPSPQAGKIVKLHGNPGDVINTGSALIEFDVEEAEADQGTVVGNIQSSDATVEETFTVGVVAAGTQQKRINATPRVRALAKSLHVDLSTMVARDPSGIISLKEVEMAAKQRASTAPRAEHKVKGEPLRGVRRVMAQSMALSHAEVVPVSLYDEADIHHWPKKSDITVRIMQAVIHACQQEPNINAWFDGSDLTLEKREHVDLGMAVDTEEGLFVPVIHQADTLSAEQLRVTINAYKKGVVDRSIASDKLQGASITLSNFGTFAGRFASAIIVPPTVAILATGKIKETAMVIDGDVEMHPFLPLSLSFDHRAVTGGEASRFLGYVIAELQR